MHTFLYYTGNMNAAQYTFIAMFMWIMKNTLINVTQIYVHSEQSTVNHSWKLFVHHYSTNMHHTHNIQTEVKDWYSAW